MTKISYKIGAVIFDEDFQTYRKANAYDIANEVKWAVYENGSLGEVYDTSDEAKRVVAEFRKYP